MNSHITQLSLYDIGLFILHSTLVPMEDGDGKCIRIKSEIRNFAKWFIEEMLSGKTYKGKGETGKRRGNSPCGQRRKIHTLNMSEQRLGWITAFFKMEMSNIINFPLSGRIVLFLGFRTGLLLTSQIFNSGCN